MNETRPGLAYLAGLAHRALNEGGSEYARNKALIAQFFHDSPALAYREEVRLTLIDALYSTRAASRRLYVITDCAEALRRAFPDDAELKARAAGWIASGFETANPLYGLFAATYGVNKSGETAKRAVSLLSKYLYFAADYSFPIYDALGANYHYTAGKKKADDFRTRFRTLKEIMDENGVEGFDRLDNFFWLYGKVTEGSFSTVLSKERYVELMRYARSKSVAAVMKDVCAGRDAAALRGILGGALYEFIRDADAACKDGTLTQSVNA